jgi:hypothetical protein
MTISWLILKISESELSFWPVATGCASLYLYVEREVARSTDSASFFGRLLEGASEERKIADMVRS